MEENNNIESIPETISETKMTENASTETSKSETVNINISLVVEMTLYVIGAILLCFAFKWYNSDLEVWSKSDPFMFSEKRYVGGDAYNYIISASRSAAVVSKSLIWTILGCTSILAGRLTAIQRKKCK